MSEVLARKKRERGGHRSSATRLMNQLTEEIVAEHGPTTDRLQQCKLSLKEKLETLKAFDQEIVALVEDAAQAHGASLNGTFAGAIGDVACFSFFPSKNMAVGGEGGMITTTRDDLAQKLSRLVDHGRNDALESIELGTNLRMSEVSAAIGRIQLNTSMNGLQRRRRD